MNLSYGYLDTATLQELQATHRSNLAILSKNASFYAKSEVPVSLTNQITHELAEIQQINQALEKRGISSNDPAPDTPIASVVNHYHGTYVNAPHSQGLINQARDVQQDFSQQATQQSTNSNSLEQAISQLTTIASQIHAEETVDQLQLAILALRAARRKIQEAQSQLNPIANNQPQLQAIINLLNTIHG